VKVYIGGRTGKQKHRNPGAFKENGSIELWIFDPTTAVAVDRVVSPAHGSTVDQAKVYPLVLIQMARARTNDQGREQAGCGGAHAGDRSDAVAPRRKFAGAALDQAIGYHFVRERALRIAEKHAHTSSGSRWRFGHPRRPTPKGGVAVLTGVRASVLQCA
jgi:hypothetical protein